MNLTLDFVHVRRENCASGSSFSVHVKGRREKKRAESSPFFRKGLKMTNQPCKSLSKETVPGLEPPASFIVPIIYHWTTTTNQPTA